MPLSPGATALDLSWCISSDYISIAPTNYITYVCTEFYNRVVLVLEPWNEYIFLAFVALYIGHYMIKKMAAHGRFLSIEGIKKSFIEALIPKRLSDAVMILSLPNYCNKSQKNKKEKALPRLTEAEDPKDH
uniref:Uncharacterized protein n=1 Tax=Glossina pallidipes TaxID=7398 RepID=A0A1A9Z6E5_GLOPL